MNAQFKQEVRDCTLDFVTAVRMTLRYEDEQFARLTALLTDLAEVLRDQTVIDKDLAADLYELPKTVRNMFLSYDGPAESRPEVFDRLEDAWVDLDALVMDCLQPADV